MDLSVLWFWIVAFLFVGYFVLDGFDFGVGMSLPFLGRDDTDRRVLINTIGPVWDLNETWVIVAGASLFAAFPEWYATLFSGFYLALLLILLALIARGVSFEYRHQRPESKWKRWFDGMIIVGSAVPALLWGVAFANIVQGVPLDADHNYTGTLFDLLNPYALLGGLTTLLLFFTHGVVFVVAEDRGRPARAGAAARGAVGPHHDRGRRRVPGLDGARVRHAVVLDPRRGGRARPHRRMARERARRRGHRVRAPRDHRRGRGARPVRVAVPRRHARVERPGEQPHDRERLEHDLHAHGHELGRRSSSCRSCSLYQGWTYWVFRKRVTRASIEAAAH